MNAFYLSIASLTLVASGGCANVIPSFNIPHLENGTPTVETIVDKINCELEEIVDENNSYLTAVVADAYDVQVAIELSLTVTDNGIISPNFSVIDGPLTVSTGIKVEQSRAQNFTEQLFFSLRDIREIAATLRNRGKYDAIRERCYRSPETNLAGKIGLKQTFALAMTSGPYLNWRASGNTGVFGGSASFVNNRELSATGPLWRLVHFSGPGNFFTASNKNNDKITYAFVRGPSAGKGINEDLKLQAQNFIADVRQNQIANSLNIISLNSRP